jgi:hypothetical protein
VPEESPLLDAVRRLDGARLARHLESRAELARAVPLLCRAVGDEACHRLWRRFPGAAAHVGEDCRSEARLRYPHLATLPLDWVAFGFPGVVMWDLHVGVILELDGAPPRTHVGVHATPAVWARVGPALERLDWTALVGQPLQLRESPAVGEIQLIQRPAPLDFADLAGEVTRLAEAAARCYAAVARVPIELGLSPAP